MYKNRETLTKEQEAARAERDAAMARAKAVSDRASELQERLAKHDQHQTLHDDVYECAVQWKVVHDAIVEAGFSDAQAFSLLQSMVQGACTPGRQGVQYPINWMSRSAHC